MSPWLIDQLAAAHVEDLRRFAAYQNAAHPEEKTTTFPFAGRAALRPRVGKLLIRAGSRLAGSEGTAPLRPARPAC
jgi:hypothetical protein